MLANKDISINSIDLVVPGDDLAQSLWEGIVTRPLRRSFESQGMDLGRLKNTWAELAPKNNISNLGTDKIRVYLSKSDKVIPYERGLMLTKEMKDIGLHPKISENKFLGHYGTLLKYYLFPHI